MITILDIQTAVCKVLTDNGFVVIANEVKEGFKKPACFVDVLPEEVELQNQFEELVCDSVEITYYPKQETREEMVTASEKIKSIFLYTPLKVEDRFLNINAISFDADNSALSATFNIEYLQETQTASEELPKMQKYTERVIYGGTSTNSD